MQEKNLTDKRKKQVIDDSESDAILKTSVQEIEEELDNLSGFQEYQRENFRQGEY